MSENRRDDNGPHEESQTADSTTGTDRQVNIPDFYANYNGPGRVVPPPRNAAAWSPWRTSREASDGPFAPVITTF